jgi:antitoxin CptB
MTETDAIRRKRLRYRSWHRGTREADLLLGRFADARLAELDPGQLDRYEALLDCADPDLWDWVVRRAPPPPPHDHDVLALIRTFVEGPRAA